MTEHVKACPFCGVVPKFYFGDNLTRCTNNACALSQAFTADECATRPEPSLNGNAELVELIQSRKNQDFDGECLLTNAEVDEIIAALSTPHGDAIPRAMLEPFANYHGDLPDYDHPLRPVFESGVQYAVELLAKVLKVEDWEICDGTEEFDGDLGGTLLNIVTATWPTDEHGDWIDLRDPENRAPAHSDGLREALERCRDQFRECERQHEAKARAANPGGSSRSMNGEAAERWAKAERNREMAGMCDAALAGQQAHE